MAQWRKIGYQHVHVVDVHFAITVQITSRPSFLTIEAQRIEMDDQRVEVVDIHIAVQVTVTELPA